MPEPAVPADPHLAARLAREGEMFEASMLRPSNYFKLTGRRQWDIDKDLGCLDWGGGCAHQEQMCVACAERYFAHYES